MANTIVLDASEWQDFIARLDSNYRLKAQRWLQTAANTIGFSDIVKHFDKEEGPEGRWVPRKDTTQRRYAQLNRKHAWFDPSNKILQLTGAMRQSIFPGRGLTKLRGKDAVEMFAGTVYSRAHDEGSRKHNLPQRSFMWLTEQAQYAILDNVMKALVAED